MEWKISQTLFSVLREVIITQIGPVEQGCYEVCAGVIRKKLYALVDFYGRTMSTKWNFSIRSDRCDVGVQSTGAQI